MMTHEQQSDKVLMLDGDVRALTISVEHIANSIDQTNKTMEKSMTAMGNKVGDLTEIMAQHIQLVETVTHLKESNREAFKNRDDSRAEFEYKINSEIASLNKAQNTDGCPSMDLKIGKLEGKLSQSIDDAVKEVTIAGWGRLKTGLSVAFVVFMPLMSGSYGYTFYVQQEIVLAEKNMTIEKLRFENHIGEYKVSKEKLSTHIKHEGLGK